LVKIDTSDMDSMVMSFPVLLEEFTLDQETRDICIRIGDEGLSGVVILGMGGSAIAGLYVQALYRDTIKLPIFVNQDYSLPGFVYSNWAVIAISYSGNTEETLAAYDEALKRDLPSFTITSGGDLLSRKQSLSRLKIPPGFQPRAAFPIIFSAVLNLVECLCGIETTDIHLIGTSLSERAAQWESSDLRPKTLARDLVTKVPLFIGARHLTPVAYRAKCQVNENAKAMAFHSEIPESNHNEIESFTGENESNVIPIFLRSAYEDTRLRKRLDVTSSIYEEAGFSPIRLSTRSSSKLEEMLSLTFYLDLVSVELAHIRKVDPVLVERISKLKSELG
jgi:glucose/mannose-6-phosphate isomerase